MTNKYTVASIQDSTSNDQVDVVVNIPLFLVPPPPPPPMISSSFSPSGVEQFPGVPKDCYSPFRKHHHVPKQISGDNNDDDDDDDDTAERQRTIRFNPRVRARDTLSHRDMSPIERRAYWIQEDEYQAITRRNARIVRAIERSYDENNNKSKNNSKRRRKQQQQQPTTSGDGSGKSGSKKAVVADPDDLCPRGLESGLRSEYKTRETAILESLEEVFNEQEKQYYVGVCDDEAVALAYSSVTSKSAFRARLRAMLDRKEVEDEEEREDASLARALAGGGGNGGCDNGGGKTRHRITGSMLRKQISSIRSWVRFGTKGSLLSSRAAAMTTTRTRTSVTKQ